MARDRGARVAAHCSTSAAARDASRRALARVGPAATGLERRVGPAGVQEVDARRPLRRRGLRLHAERRVKNAAAGSTRSTSRTQCTPTSAQDVGARVNGRIVVPLHTPCKAATSSEVLTTKSGGVLSGTGQPREIVGARNKIRQWFTRETLRRPSRRAAMPSSSAEGAELRPEDRGPGGSRAGDSRAGFKKAEDSTLRWAPGSCLRTRS